MTDNGSVTSIYLEQEEDSSSSEEEIIFHNGACTLTEPTDDTKADQIGKDLQETEDAITSLHLNYTQWTKWGAHAICQFMETSVELEKVTLQFEEERSSSITSTRTLAAIGEALANNKTATIRQVKLVQVQLQAKSVLPLAQFLRDSTTLHTLALVGVAWEGTGTTGKQFAEAIRASPSLQKLWFYNDSNTVIRTILEVMSLGCPSTLRLLELERTEREEIDLDTSGLEILLQADSCRIQQLKFDTIRFGRESMEGLHRGLRNNTSVKYLNLRECPLHEPLLQQMLQDMTSVRNLQLDCFPLRPDRTAGVLGALQHNTGVAHCELLNLPPLCGPALRDVLTHNRTLASLQLNNADRVLSNPQVNMVEEEAIQMLAEGLRVNATLQSLSLKALGLTPNGMEHLAKALDRSAPLDLTLDWDAISVEGLDHLSKALSQPTCRLRHLKLELEDTVNVSLNAGMVRFLEAMEQSPLLESVHLEPSTEGEGLAPPLFARLAHAFIRTTCLKKLVFLFGMDNERAWRQMDPQIIATVQSDLFVGLAKNYTLEHVQFANIFYNCSTPDDREFWRDVSFFGMRNRLLKGLDSGTIADDIGSVPAARSLAQTMVLEEIATRKPWTLRRWKSKRESNPVRHELNELSLFFLCLQHLPHLLRGGTASNSSSEAEQPFLPLMELD